MFIIDSSLTDKHLEKETVSYAYRLSERDSSLLFDVDLLIKDIKYDLHGSTDLWDDVLTLCPTCKNESDSMINIINSNNNLVANDVTDWDESYGFKVFNGSEGVYLPYTFTTNAGTAFMVISEAITGSDREFLTPYFDLVASSISAEKLDLGGSDAALRAKVSSNRSADILYTETDVNFFGLLVTSTATVAYSQETSELVTGGLGSTDPDLWQFVSYVGGSGSINQFIAGAMVAGKVISDANMIALERSLNAFSVRRGYA